MSAAERGLARLVERYQLDAAAVERLEALLGQLESSRSPTTVREPGRAVDVHLADSLVALERPELVTGAVLADLGSGAGFPALALAACRPDLHVFAVESVGRKAAFIEAAVQVAGLENVTVVAGRAEAWRAGIGMCEVVTARALGPLAVIAEYAAPLLRAGGCLVAWKTQPDASEELAGARAAEALGLRANPPQPVDPFPDAGLRRLYVWPKVAPTPDRFPRRPGMARKRAL